MSLEGWNTIASFLSPVTNFVSGLFTNASNQKQVQETNAANMAMNAANIEFQKQENEIARQREDNAVQRRAADLTAAGLSKTLAAGSPASANQMNAPNNSFSMQPTRFDAPQFNYDHAAVTRNLADAKAATKNADTADKEAETNRMRVKFEILKFAKEHGLDLRKFGLDLEQFEHQKSMDQKNFELKEFIEKSQLTLDQMKYELSAEELGIKRDELNNKLLDSMSERDYREWSKTYEAAKLELDRNADSRAARLAEYQITEIQAKVQVYLSEVKLNDAQIAYVKKNTKKIIAEILHYYDEHFKIGAEVSSILQKTITEIYDRSVAQSDGGKTSDKTVTSSEAHENALDRATEESVAGTASMRQFFSIVLMALMGFGKGVKLP